ncbi:hypothetical protein CLU79DRAFT_739713 [Phycomyces nitens]|nr:hypothetical protein CLU79DRAFT_739713 [Phycomyces nitens]
MDTDELMSLWQTPGVDGCRVFTVYLRQPDESKWNFVHLSGPSGLEQLERVLMAGPRAGVNLDHHPLTRMLQDSLSHVVVVLASISDETSALDTIKLCSRLRHRTPTRPRQVSHLHLNLNLDSPKKPPLDDEVRQMRQELRQLQSFTQQLSHELALAQSERDSLISRCAVDGSIESNSVLLQQAETIQRLKREAAETQSTLSRLQSPSGRASQATTPREDSFRVASTSSGRRKVKHVSVHRPALTKRRSGISQTPKSPFGGSFTTLNTESLGEVLAMLRHDLDACPSTHSSTEFPRRTDDRSTQPYTANPPPWSQASDETVTPDHAEARPPQTPSSSLLPMPALLQDDSLQSSLEDDLEALAVPAWTDVPKTQSTNGSTKRESLSWTDSVLDDSDNSVVTSSLSGWTTTSRSREGRRRSKDLLKMLHQVQADVLVKRELVGQLEKTEEEYTQMRVNYEEQLSLLHGHLQEHHGSPIETSPVQSLPPASPPTQPPSRVGLSRPSSVAQLREERLTQEVVSQYEAKLKRMFNENQDLHRKYTQTASTLQNTRTKGEAIVSRLKATVDSLKAEKKQLQRTIRQEADHARETAIVNEREIQQLRRREMNALEAKKRLEEANEVQAQIIKRKNEDMALANLQNRLLVNALRKAAGEGTLLNEASLDKIMAGVQTRLTKTRLTD